MFCWHKWSKWEEYEAKFVEPVKMELVYLAILDKEIKYVEEYTKIRQQRECQKCGKHQRQRV